MTEAKPSWMEICQVLFLVLVFLVMTAFVIPEDNRDAARQANTPKVQAHTEL